MLLGNWCSYTGTKASYFILLNIIYEFYCMDILAIGFLNLI